MSHAAIAAVLARPELSGGERLVAWSLASFANRDQRAWPGIPAAAARAGLSRSRYLEVREQLVRRGLLEIEATGAAGRGRATTVRLLFAQCGPWWECEVNVHLAEVVLGCSPARGPARLLLAALAALSDENGGVEGLATEELCRAAGLANSTYRRARTALLAAGEVELVDDGGGRSRMNRWRVLAPAGRLNSASVSPRRRRAPVPGQPPLLSPVQPEPATAVAPEPRGGEALTRAEIGPDVSGVTDRRGPGLSGVSRRKGPILTGVSPSKGPDLSGVSNVNPATTPPETPSPNTRVGREPLNPGTRKPPTPPQGGSAARWVIIDESFVSDRGRRRRRPVRVDLDEIRQCLDVPSAQDLTVWRKIRSQLQRLVGEDTFAIWLKPIELVAIDSAERLVLAGPAPTAEWTNKRFSRVIATSASEVGRDIRFANEAERHAFGACAPGDPIHINPKEAAR